MTPKCHPARLVLAVLLCLASGAAGAALVEDQRGLSAGAGVSGGVSGTAAQSFRPAADNLAGVDVYLYNVAALIAGGGGALDYTADVSFALYAADDIEDFGYAGGAVLATDTFFLDTGTSRTGWAEFRFGPVPVTPESFYVLEFSTDNGVFGAASSSTYDRGQWLEFGLGRDYFDLHFVSYFDNAFTVPLPPAAWLLTSAMLLLAARGRRTSR